MNDLADHYASAVQLYQSLVEVSESNPDLDLNDALAHADNLVLALCAQWNSDYNNDPDAPQ